MYIDNAIGSIINELKAQNLFTTTSIIITAKHGQSPRNPNLVRAASPGWHDCSDRCVLRWQLLIRCAKVMPSAPFEPALRAMMPLCHHRTACDDGGWWGIAAEDAPLDLSFVPLTS